MDILTNLSPITQFFLGGLGTIFVLVNTYDKLFSKRAKMLNNADDRLVALLKSTVDEQEKRIKQLENDHKENTRLIARLEGENESLKAILQGRDENTMRAYAQIQELTVQIPTVLTTIQSTLEVASANSEHVSKLYDLLEKHFELSEK